MTKQILYIEDDQQIGEWVQEHLTEKGYEVLWLTSGEQAADYWGRSDLVILDVMLPGLDGFSIGQRMKKTEPDIPILMLSARTSIEDKLQGLHFADDYLTKPFHPDELAARVEVLLRRNGKPLADVFRLHHLLINLEQHLITNEESGEEILLTGKQFRIFEHFLGHPNQILTKEQIYEAVWGEPYLEGDKTVMVHIRYLREKIERDPSNPEIIETIRGIGYRVRV